MAETGDSVDKPAGDPASEYVANRVIRPWFLTMWVFPLATGAGVVAVSLLGGAVRQVFDHQVTLPMIAASAAALGAIAAAYTAAQPTELRISGEGISARTWRQAVEGWGGNFIEVTERPVFVMRASGSYIRAPGREDLRIRVPTLELHRAARNAGLPLERRRSWWAWTVLAWTGLLVWWLVPPVGAVMLLAALAVRTASRA